ncbi:MAG TPA: hypothetical protein VNA89_05735 [Gemmatimonadaceae bacterium]|nr:hypothetical protein [Gemmatimonadaceae bacterium]
MRATVPRVAAGGLALALTGCALAANTARSYATAPNGMEAGEVALRRSLEAGRVDSLWALFSGGAKRRGPTDDLLRLMYQGLLAYYAGSYEASAGALDRAYALAEDRYTNSATRAAASLLTNDLALEYEPGHTERLLIHYYAMLDYLRRDSLEGAVVEARRLSHQLQRFDEQRASADVSTRALLRYLAGAVFEAAGEAADAEVAYRNARALAGDSAFPAASMLPPDTARPRGRRGLARGAGAQPAGEVVVILEHGFVAHRVHQGFTVALRRDEVSGFEHDRKHDRDSTARRVSARVYTHVLGRADDGLWVREKTDAHGHHRAELDLNDGDADVYLTVSWPGYRRPRHAAPAARVVGPEGRTATVSMLANVSDAVAGDFRRERGQILARSIARAAAKRAVAEAAGRQAKKKGDEAGWLAKWGVSAVGSLMDRADLRSWHLLPGEIGIVRLSLPAGRHALSLDTTGDRGQRLPYAPLGEVDVRPGEIRFVTTRLWCDPDAPPSTTGR